MTDERRYGQDEIREIFRTVSDPAAESGRPQPVASSAGLTLTQLQEIGAEVGLAPRRIAEAASALDHRRGAQPRRSHFGMPISVGRIVDLPRAPTDREWEMLVAELRSTFNAQGELHSHGAIREWSNGNLHASIEPTEAGYRLRMGTFRELAYSLSWMGLGGIVFTLLVLMVTMLTGKLDKGLAVAGIFGLPSLAVLASTAIGQPRWALRREEQMAHIAARAQALIQAQDDPAVEGQEP